MGGLIDPMKRRFFQSMDEAIAANRSTPFQTNLTPAQDLEYRQWVEENKIPQSKDYDMRGFFNDANAEAGVSPMDRRLHFTDKYKTPEHKTFSQESIYAKPGAAPKWRGNALVDKKGQVVFVELPQ